VADLIYAAAPWVALAIAAANWRPIVWLAKTLTRSVPGASNDQQEQPR
jgi:hypothetical protein